jgi:hypothetical protein
VLPFTVGIRDGVVHLLVSTSGSAVPRCAAGGEGAQRGQRSREGEVPLRHTTSVTPYLSAEITPISGSISGFN